MKYFFISYPFILIIFDNPEQTLDLIIYKRPV